MGARAAPGGFVEFFRDYATSWVHAVAAAGLSAFGTLTFVHRGFAVLAIAAYVVPPAVLYLRWRRVAAGSAGGDAGGGPGAEAGSRSGGGPRSGRGRGADSSEDVDVDTAPAAGTDTAPGSNTDDGGAARPRAPDRGRWSAVASPTESALCDVAVTAVGACAVGDDGVAVADAGSGWRTVLQDGPAARGEDLRGVSATDDGEAVWVVGDSGAVGRLDAESGRHTDYSGPAGRTDDLTGVAAAGSAGTETVLLIDGSGQVVRGRYREGTVSWDDPVKPGGGSSLVGIDAVDAAVSYCCDTNDGVFETGDGGETFDRIGLDGPDGTLTDVAAVARGDVLASDDDGVVHRFDGSTWTPERVDDRELTAIARHGDRAVACDADGGVSERSPASAAWTRVDVGLSGELEGVAVSADRAVAVGDDGAIVQRR